MRKLQFTSESEYVNICIHLLLE